MDIELAGEPFDPSIVMGWMLFPERPDLRTAHMARTVIDYCIGSARTGDTVEVDAELLKRILDGPGREELRQLTRDATKRGTVAGDLLFLMMEQDHNGKPTSKQKAVQSYAKFALGKTYGDGTPLKYSRANLLAYLNEFGSVAHLWAAQRLIGNPTGQLDPFGSLEGLNVLLGVAKTIGRFASTYIPARVKPREPLIPKSKLVGLPASVPALSIPWAVGEISRPV